MAKNRKRERTPGAATRHGEPVGSRRHGSVGLLAGCLLVSGAAALIYEVVWFRLFSLVMGSTAYAMAAMLTAFLGGLALGAWAGGRWTRRRRIGLGAYAAVELGIASTALAVPLLIDWMAPVFGVAHRSLGDRFVVYNLVQFVICGVVLLVPTALMGATLPIVVALTARRGLPAGRSAGLMYAANSLGGAAGVAAAGFALLPFLGVGRTALVAAGLNLAVAVAALVARRGEVAGSSACSAEAPSEPERPHAPPPDDVSGRDFPAPRPWLLALLYGVSGFGAMALEVGWARIVGLSVGSTVYGFTITLFTYITGLATGSWLAPRVGPLARNPVRSLVLLQALVGASAILSIPYLGDLPLRVARIFGDADLTFGSLVRQELLLVWLTILVPTLAMGAMFPLVSALVQRKVASTGQAVGTAYAANTWGGILGSFGAGFVLIPRIGMRATVFAAGLLSVVVSVSLLIPAIRESRKSSRTWAMAVLVVVVAVGLGVPDWDRNVVTSGPYVFGKSIMQQAGSAGESEVREAILGMFDELVDYREDATGVVTVKRRGNAWSMQVGGKSDAFSYASTQNFIAHLPLALHGAAKEVLIVGLGSASTLGSALSHPLDQVDVVEISATVAEFARKYFSEYTGNALDDPRAVLHIGDGRNHLRHARRSWDVIVSQPSNPWISGAASLFTREFFADMRAHLAPRGIACAWFKPSDARSETMTSVLRTWADVFEYPFLFESRLLGEYVLIGSVDRPTFSYSDVSRSLARHEVAVDLGRIQIASAEDLLGYLLTGPEGVRAISRPGRINTDDNAFIEFLAPTAIFRDVRLDTQNLVHAARANPIDFVSELGGPQAQPGEAALTLQRIYESKALILEARNLERSEGRSARWRQTGSRALQLNPRDPYVARFRRSPGM